MSPKIKARKKKAAKKKATKPQRVMNKVETRKPQRFMNKVETSKLSYASGSSVTRTVYEVPPIRLPRWRIEEISDYKPMTTFYTDFTIADAWGEEGVRDTFRIAFNSWKYLYDYLTELVIVLHYKFLEYCETKPELADVYFDLYEKANEYAEANLEGEELEYFQKTVNYRR